jgi:glycosyltransferase involved in cell wall biosynthesis
VLLPVRDAAATIDEAVASVLAQSHRNLELIAVDDGSADDSAARLAGWASRDPRVRILQGPPRGLVAALEQGLALCRARLVARMDADDLCHPERLEAQLALLDQRPALGVVATQVQGMLAMPEPPGSLQVYVTVGAPVPAFHQPVDASAFGETAAKEVKVQLHQGLACVERDDGLRGDGSFVSHVTAVYWSPCLRGLPLPRRRGQFPALSSYGAARTRWCRRSAFRPRA